MCPKMFLNLILAYLTSSYTCVDIDVISMLPDLLQEYCPDNNVCSDYPQTRTDSELKQSCCTECSCGEKCSESGNCCFQDKVSERFGNDPFNARTCLYPTTSPPREWQRQLYQSYYMTSSINNADQRSTEFMTNTSCGDEKVAPWGSLYPVYSARNNKIYKNVKCANDDGVYDGHHWDAIMSCKYSYNADLSQFVQGLDTMSFNERCFIDFIVPEMSNERSLQCFEDVIKTCPEQNEFEIPKATNVSKEIIVTLCESGLLSPYRSQKRYANVFCYICNGEAFTNKNLCNGDVKHNIFSLGNTVSMKYGRLSFVGLIDQSFINNGKSTDTREAGSIKQACDTANTCRPLFCSSGKLRDHAGNCVYPNKKWFVNLNYVSVNLTLNKNINVSDVFNIPFMEVLLILPRLNTPWSDNWKIHSIFYDINDSNNELTSRLIVTLYTTLNMVQPKRFMHNIRNTITQDWVLHHENNVTVMKAEFSSISFTNTMRTRQMVRSYFKDDSINIPTKEFMLLYKLLPRPSINTMITKLYLCGQVELQQSEFILSPDRLVLFYLRTQRYLFDCQFAVVSSISEAETRVRICIEDSGMSISNFSASSFHNMYDICCVIAAVIVFTHHFI